MIRKKGFTLIELLAVIVILAIIAVVTIPMIMNVIEKAKKGALEDSAYGLIESANLYYSENVKEITSPVTFDYANGEQISESKLKYKGKIENGKLILNTDGKVILCIDNGKNYAYKELSENKVTTGNGTCSYDGKTGTFEILSDVESLNREKRELEEEITRLSSIGNATAEDILEGKTTLVQGEEVVGTLKTTNFYLETFESKSNSNASATGPDSTLIINKESGTIWNTLSIGKIVGSCSKYGSTTIYLDDEVIYYRAPSPTATTNLSFNISSGNTVKIYFHNDSTCYVRTEYIKIT